MLAAAPAAASALAVVPAEIPTTDRALLSRLRQVAALAAALAAHPDADADTEAALRRALSGIRRLRALRSSYVKKFV